MNGLKPTVVSDAGNHTKTVGLLKNVANAARTNLLIENGHGISPENNKNETTNERTGLIVACISPDNRTTKRTGFPKNHTLRRLV